MAGCWHRSLIAAVVLAAAIASAPPALSKGPQDDAELHAATRQLAVLIGEAREELLPVPPYAPLYVRWKPVDGWSSGEGALVLFSLEGRGGSNTFSLYLAYFQKLEPASDLQREQLAAQGKWRNFRLIDFAHIGGRMWRSVEWKQARITRDAVTIPTTPWLESDPGCCPSGQGAIRIALDKTGRLRVTDSLVKSPQ